MSTPTYEIKGWSSVPNWVIRSGELNASEKLIYIALLNRANTDGVCWPSLSTLMKDGGCSKPTVLKALKSLEEKRLITKVPRRDKDGSRESNLYRVHAWEGGKESLPPPSKEPLRGVVKNSTRGSKKQYQEVLPTEVLPIERAPGKPDATKGTRIPDDFTITDRMREWAQREFPEIDIDAETPQFIDHWKSISGNKGVKLDWVATWRNWIRNARKFMPAHKRQPTNQYDPWTNTITAAEYRKQQKGDSQ